MIASSNWLLRQRRVETQHGLTGLRALYLAHVNIISVPEPGSRKSWKLPEYAQSERGVSGKLIRIR